MKVLKLFIVISWLSMLIVVLFFVRQGLTDNDVPTVVGEAVSARPLAVLELPAHPFLAEPQRSGMHGGSYNQDISAYPGPLGVNTVALHREFSSLGGMAPNITFDGKGRLITVSVQFGRTELLLLDPEKLETLAMYRMPKTRSRDNSGGIYFHLDHKDRVILAPNDNTIKIMEVVDDADGVHWKVLETYILGGLFPDNARVHDVMPDWQGNLWFVTTENYIGYRDADTEKLYSVPLELGDEKIRNSLAIAQDGVYVLSDHALYRFEIDPETKEPRWSWREAYDEGSLRKPGMRGYGSGTTPTLVGNDLVAIVDAASPRAQILVYKRLADHQGERLICKEPIFKSGFSATENSLMVYGNAMVVQNDYGRDVNDSALRTAPGISRVDINDARDGCHTVWESQLRSQSLPRLSMATGLIYLYTFSLPYPEAKTGGWYLTALDFKTGEELFSRLIGKGLGGNKDVLSGVSSPVVLGPNGAAYLGVRTGLVYVKDKP